MRADLHVHSSASDGTEPPAEVMRRAAQAGLDVVALTDHDTVAGHAEARRALADSPASLTLLPGMELSCRLDGRSVHLLAYLFDAGSPGTGRRTRPHPGRPRAARAGHGEPARGPRRRTSAGTRWPPSPARPWSAARTSPARWRPAAPSPRPARRSPATGSPTAAGPTSAGTRSIRSTRSAWSATRAASRCWPTRGRAGTPEYPTSRSPGWPPQAWPGVEVFHPDQSDAERARLLALAHDLGLVATGGSDDHGSLTGYRIGAETAAAGVYEALVAQTRPGSRPAPPRPTRDMVPQWASHRHCAKMSAASSTRNWTPGSGRPCSAGSPSRPRSAPSGASPTASRRAGGRSATSASAVSTCTTTCGASA